MHFSFVSQLMIFGNYDNLALPQRQQRQPKPGEYFITSVFSQKISFFHIFDRMPMNFPYFTGKQEKIECEDLGLMIL